MDEEDEILGTMLRIAGDFQSMLPELRVEVLSLDAFTARLAGRPLIAGQAAPEEETEEPVRHELPVRALAASRIIMVEMEALRQRVLREDRRLRRPLVEGLVLREILYLITCRQPMPEPRARAEAILRRHWPFQYTVLRCLGLAGPAYPIGGRSPNMAHSN